MSWGGWSVGAAARRLRSVLSPVAQASVAAGAAWYVAHDLLGHPQPFFAPIAAAVALSTSHVQRARRSVQMVVGVLLGIGVSELLYPLVGTSPLSIVAVVAVTLLLAVALGVGFVGEGMMFFNQAAASAILVIAVHRAGTGSERAVDALVGGAVALVIGIGLFPADPLKLLWGAERRVLRSLLALLEGDPPAAAAEGDADSDWALAASHDVHRQLTGLTQARSTARASVRVAPRRMALRPYVEREERRVGRMYLLASAVLTLMRATMDRVEDPAPELAGALRLLVEAPRPWPAETLLTVRERMQELLGRAVPEESPERAILATAARRVASDLLRLLPPGSGGE